MWEQLKQKDGCETCGGRAIISWARMNFGEEGGRALAGGLDSAPWKNTRPTCCEMAPQRRSFEPELIDSLCHDADELLNFSTLSLALLWVWRYMKRMTVRGRGQSQQSTPRPPEKSPLRPKQPEKKAVIYFDVTCIKRVHVTNCRGTLIMLSEEDGRILCPLFFLTDSWEKENGRARGVESPSEKKANREHKHAKLKHSKWEHSAPLSAASAWDFPKRDTHSARVSSACRGFTHVLQWRRGICNNAGLKFALLVRLS